MKKIFLALVVAICSFVLCSCGVANRNQKKAAVSSANNAFESARVILLSSVEADDYLVFEGDDGGLYTNTTLLQGEGELAKWSSENDEIFFYYVNNSFYALKSEPTSSAAYPTFTKDKPYGYEGKDIPTFEVEGYKVKWNGYDLKFV